jgi:hypothetical protein
MAKKKYEVTMIVECKEGHQKYIANAVCDGLEDETCVTYINVEESIECSLDLDLEFARESE